MRLRRGFLQQLGEPRGQELYGSIGLGLGVCAGSNLNKHGSGQQVLIVAVGRNVDRTHKAGGVLLQDLIEPGGERKIFLPVRMLKPVFWAAHDQHKLCGADAVNGEKGAVFDALAEIMESRCRSMMICTDGFSASTCSATVRLLLYAWLKDGVSQWVVSWMTLIPRRSKAAASVSPTATTLFRSSWS